MTPSQNGRNGSGKFVQGNPGGPGNPYAAQVAKLRSALLNAVTADDIQAVIGKLIEQAKGGDIAAIHELFDRCLGKAFAGSEPTDPLAVWREQQAVASAILRAD